MNEKEYIKELDKQQEKLKQINEFAKSIGVTVYYIQAGVIIDNKEWFLNDSTLNKHPKMYNLTAERQKEYENLKSKNSLDYYDVMKKHGFKIVNRFPRFEIVSELNIK